MVDDVKMAPALDVGFWLAVGEMPSTEVVGGSKEDEEDVAFGVSGEEEGGIFVSGGALELASRAVKLCCILVLL